MWLWPLTGTGNLPFASTEPWELVRAARPGSLDNGEAFTVGRRSGSGTDFFQGRIDLIRVHRGRALSGAELQDNWRIIQGQVNGSAYPEVGSGLGQYWAFLRLAEFFFLSHDPAAEAILLNWLTWIDGVGAPDGNGWKVPPNSRSLVHLRGL
jgi:hypothetical protein